MTKEQGFANKRDWLLFKQRYLSASEIPALVLPKYYSTPYDLYSQKTSALVEKDNQYMKAGRLLEAAVINWFCDEYGYSQVLSPQKQPYQVWYLDEAPVLCTPDALVTPNMVHVGDMDAVELVEAKTTQYSLDEPEPAWLLQLQFQMRIVGADVGHIVWCEHGLHFKKETVQHNPELTDYLLEEATKFMESHVFAGVPPQPQTGEDVAKMYPTPTPDKMVEAVDDVHQRYLELLSVKKQLSELEAKRDELEGDLKVVMKDAEVLQYGGKTIATYKSVKGRVSFQANEFEKDHPEMYAVYTKMGPSYRRFSLK